MFERLSAAWQAFRSGPQVQVVTAPGQPVEKPWTIQVCILTKQADLLEVVDFANTHCQSVRAQSMRIRPIKHGQIDVSETLMTKLSAYRLPKMAAIQEIVPLDPRFVKRNPTTIQFVLFRESDPEQAVQRANQFCLQHQARQADIQFDEDTKKWAIVITYEI